MPGKPADNIFSTSLTPDDPETEITLHSNSLHVFYRSADFGDHRSDES